MLIDVVGLLDSLMVEAVATNDARSALDAAETSLELIQTLLGWIAEGLPPDVLEDIRRGGGF